MANSNDKINEKIAKRRQKLIKACLEHDTTKQLKQRLKLFKLFIKRQESQD